MNYEVAYVYIDNYSSKYDLGVIFDSNLLFDSHIDKTKKKANQTLGILRELN